MINFDFNEYCCGCGSCANACNHQAINMEPNCEGFLMPHVDTKKCVNCGLCDKVCPYLNSNDKKFDKYSINDFNGKKAFLYFSKNDKRIDSASGGFVYDLNNQIINEGGFACGCIWDESIKAIHIVGNKEEDINKFQSSKYVQSDLGSCFKTIKNHLKNNKKVVFCGTPCQTAALKHYLGELNVSPLLSSVCVICHGVPSPEVWRKYKTALENKYNAKMSFCNMRDKSKQGYSKSFVKYIFHKNVSAGPNKVLAETLEEYFPTFLQEPYVFLFTDDLYIRNSCNHCNYKSIYSGADIMVGDFYQSTPSAGNEGCSSIVSLSAKGDEIMKHLTGEVICVPIETVLSVNPMAFSSTPRNPQRYEFFSKFAEISDSDFIAYLNSFLPFRFHVKVLLDKLGMYNIVRRLIKG